MKDLSSQEVPTGSGGEPMPAHIMPMLATLSDLPNDQDSYGFEYKWDGVRAIFFFDGRLLRIETRNLIDVTLNYPELSALIVKSGWGQVLGCGVRPLDLDSIEA